MTSNGNFNPEQLNAGAAEDAEPARGLMTDIYTAALLAASPDGINLIDIDGTIRTVNKAAIRLMELEDAMD